MSRSRRLIGSSQKWRWECLVLQVLRLSALGTECQLSFRALQGHSRFLHLTGCVDFVLGVSTPIPRVNGDLVVADPMAHHAERVVVGRIG